MLYLTDFLIKKNQSLCARLEIYSLNSTVSTTKLSSVSDKVTRYLTIYIFIQLFSLCLFQVHFIIFDHYTNVHRLVDMKPSVYSINKA